MECASSFDEVGLFDIVVGKARKLKRISEISGRETIAKEFSKGPASVAFTRVREVVVNVRLARGCKEEHPILFNGCPSIGGVPSQFGKGGIRL